jgi:uroporphyrin-III C-methyltransferase
MTARPSSLWQMLTHPTVCSHRLCFGLGAVALELGRALLQRRAAPPPPAGDAPFARAAALLDAGGAPRSFTPAPPGSARITLVGGGPGAPDLLTLAAYLALQHADVVISDLIAPPALRAVAPPHAEFHVADKVPGNADSAQAHVNRVGLEALRRGLRVVRLKVGDPYLYGRAGEEVAFFRAAGFEPCVLPGVCTALAAPAAAGIPVTHRGAANQVLFSTGQGRGGGFPDVPRFDAARTLVLLMAVGRIPQLRDDLCAQRGYPEDTPVAVVERATHADQRVTRSTLGALAAAAAAAGIESPAVIIVGAVCTALEAAGLAGVAA